MRKSGKKSNSKFHPLSSADIAEEKILLPGRRECTCEASKHALINNCVQCGRIVCTQEGSGPCFTCGELVCTTKEKEVIVRQSKTSLKLYQKLMNLDKDVTVGSLPMTNDPKLRRAVDHKDKLLECDRNAELRMKVIDDENDYFRVDSRWLSEKERKILNKKKEEFHDALHNRQKQKMTFDFAGRQVMEEKPELNFNAEELLKPDTSIFDYKDYTIQDVPLDMHLIYDDNVETEEYRLPVNKENKRLHVRIQDKELQEMSDEGNCLSLHQPYASLLVEGIKKHEGRVWYTSYRGRLWIHAAGKVPSKQDIIDMENIYRHIESNPNFPKTYPTGCLLGCVDVVDCLPQEEYKSQYPHGEIASPYVFICENAQELTVKFPMKGKHKIFKLDSNFHQAAKKALRKVI